MFFTAVKLQQIFGNVLKLTHFLSFFFSLVILGFKLSFALERQALTLESGPQHLVYFKWNSIWGKNSDSVDL
jgi:hypothetical protein